MSEKQEIKVNDSITIVCKVHLDESCEVDDYYGKFSKDPTEWCVDRRRGVLLGEQAEEPQWSYRQKELEESLYERSKSNFQESDIPDEEYEELEALRKEFDKRYEEWEENRGLKVMATDLGRFAYDYHDWDFYWPYFENYQDDTEENKIKYILQDHKHFEDIHSGHVWFNCYHVIVFVDGIEVASESSGGIISEIDRVDKEEIWGDLLDECFSNITKKISDMVNALQMGFANLPSEETIADLVKEIE